MGRRTIFSTSGYRANARRQLTGGRGRYTTRNGMYRDVRRGLGLSGG